MDTESERIDDRMGLHRLMREHPGWNPAQVAEAVGWSVRCLFISNSSPLTNGNVFTEVA